MYICEKCIHVGACTGAGHVAREFGLNAMSNKGGYSCCGPNRFIKAIRRM